MNDLTLKLLRASVDLIEKDKRIAELENTVKFQEAQITALQCRLRRATPRWEKNQGVSV